MKKLTHRWSLAAFTLMEQMAAAAAVGIISAIVYAMLNAGSIMYTRIVQVNAVHRTARSAAEVVSARLYEAVGQPILLNATAVPHAPVDAPIGYKTDGIATEAENFKPSEGVLFMRYVGSLMVSSGVNATSSNMMVKNFPRGLSPQYNSTPPAGYLGMVEVGDILECSVPPFRIQVAGVTPTDLDAGAYKKLQLTFAENVGTKTLPSVTVSTPNFIPVDAQISVYRQASFMAVQALACSTKEYAFPGA